MKARIIIVLFMIGLGFSSANAQKAKRFEVAAKAGVGSSWIINQNNYGLNEMEYEYTLGTAFNLQVGYNFNSNIGLFAEVGTRSQGQDYSDTWNNKNDIKREVSLSYLTVPLLFKYSYGESIARFRLLVGPEISFLQKAEQVYTFDGKSMEGKFEITDKDGHTFDPAAKDITDRYNSMDVSAVIDLGADIFIIQEVFYISAGARFYYGLMDINASAYQIENKEGKYEASHNAGIMFDLGFHYVIGAKKIN